MSAPHHDESKAGETGTTGSQNRFNQSSPKASVTRTVAARGLCKRDLRVERETEVID
jgi:hypothetical protein